LIFEAICASFYGNNLVKFLDYPATCVIFCSLG